MRAEKKKEKKMKNNLWKNGGGWFSCVSDRGGEGGERDLTRKRDLTLGGKKKNVHSVPYIHGQMVAFYTAKLLCIQSIGAHVCRGTHFWIYFCLGGGG